MYAYSAHYDDRESVPKPTVRILIVTELEKTDLLYCYMWFNRHQPVTIVHGVLEEIGAGIDKRNKVLMEYILSCPLDSSEVPTHVSIISWNTNEPSFAMPVELPDDEHVTGSTSQSIGICVSLAYWHHSPDRLVEWIEFQRLMGVQGIVIYNNSLTQQAQAVFAYYASNEPDFLQLRQSRNFIADNDELTFHVQMSPVINDCMYRYRKRFQTILVIDIDEQAVPHGSCTNLTQMLQGMERRQRGYQHIPNTYSLRNAYFFADFESRSDQPKELNSLRYTKRAALSEMGYSTKSFIGSDVCIAMHNHFCWRFTPAYESDEILEPYVEV